MYRDWLDKYGVNDFLKRAQKNQRFRDMIIERLGHAYGLLMVEEEEKTQLAEALSSREKTIDHLNNKVLFMQDAMAVEEDAKRRMLLRYIHAVKEQAAGEAPTNVDGTPVGGVLMLPESNISDEEVHALAALLRNNTSIEKVDLRGNNITDDGARALGAVLAGRSGLQSIDLRANKIGPGAIRILAEALERSERVRHVYVHAGGKIEALGTKRVGTIKVGQGSPGAGSAGGDLSVAVETVCVVDIRDNNPKDINQNYELLSIDAPLREGDAAKSQFQREQIASQAAQYNPLVHLDSMVAPPKGMGPPTMVTGNGPLMIVDDKKKKKKKKSKGGMVVSASESDLSESEKRRAKQRVCICMHVCTALVCGCSFYVQSISR
jgi:myosin protein heavy chain